MRAVTVDQMRSLDCRTIKEHGVPGAELMVRAGHGVGRIIRRWLHVARPMPDPVLLVAGRGNNGGDAFAAACYLHDCHVPVEVWLAGSSDQVQCEARIHLDMMRQLPIPFFQLPGEVDWQQPVNRRVFSVIVDGLLGTGSHGEPRGVIARAIHFINRQRAGLVVAIDLPSGLDADTGCPTTSTVRADITVALALPKAGLLRPEAREYVGALDVVDIGIPPDYVAQIPDAIEPELITAADIAPLFSRRPRLSHKGDFGHALLIGGAQGYTGAIALAALAALRSGAGLVSVLTPRTLAPMVAGVAPEAMVHAGEETESGSLAADLWTHWQPRLREFDAILVGPGMTRNEHTRLLVEQLMQHAAAPLILDADALNVLAGSADRLKNVTVPVVLTPHPGELARLLGVTTTAVQANRLAAIKQAVNLTGAAVILKGSGTLVAAPGHACAINLTGNPGLAKGGSGDALAGLLTGLLAQGLPAYDAACAAVFMHGRSADRAAARLSEPGLIARDVVDEMPYVFQ